MEAFITAAKIGKYATSESGDTLEIVERPGGGISVVLADGQRSGRSAKAISNIVVRKTLSLLAEGVRDGAAARAASDYLYTYRAGQVLSTLNILSIDLQSQSLVITRNNPEPVLLIRDGSIHLLNDDSRAIGTVREIRPSIIEVPLEPWLIAIAFTDGLAYAGDCKGKRMDVPGFIESKLNEDPITPAMWAEDLLSCALNLEDDRPCDDISVVVVAIIPNRQDDIRRVQARMPI
ncbi:MAG: SpoIIE family protein phosphatase [Anaerolineales bacterium]|nr:SpoIIE family protein phosphatase [Anaerolineales bacterium]